MCDKCNDLSRDYIELIGINKDVIIDLKQILEEKDHLKRAIKLLLTGLNTKDKPKVDRLFKNHSTEEIAIMIFHEVVVRKRKPEEIIDELERKGKLQEAS